jgi:hypothetical protein
MHFPNLIIRLNSNLTFSRLHPPLAGRVARSRRRYYPCNPHTTMPPQDDGELR